MEQAAAAGHTSEGDSPSDSPFPPNRPILSHTPDNDNSGRESDNGQLGLLTPLDPKIISTTTILPPSESVNPSLTPSKKAKKLRKRTALFKSPKRSDAALVITNHKLKDRVSTLEHDLVEVRELLEFYKNTIQSDILDSFQKVKNEAKIIARDNHDETTDRCDTLEDKVEELENSDSRQQQIIKSLKSRISYLEKQNKLDTCGCTCACTLPKQPSSPTERHAPHDRNPERPVLTQSGPSGDGPRHARSGSGDHVNNNDDPDRPDTQPQYSPTTDSSPPPATDSSPSPSATSPSTATRDSLRQEGQGRDGAKSGHADHGGITARAPTSQTQTETRKQTVNVSIEPEVDTNALLIGDSVIRGINPDKSNNSDLKWQSFVIPGCRPQHIRNYLDNSTPNPNIQEVTLHVGVNNTKEEMISIKEWSDTFKTVMYAYPVAHITASAILPSKGKDQMHQNIQASNTNLKKTCTRLGITLVEHNHTFQAPSGAPKLALYRDKYHPSRKGTALLAINLFGECNTNTKNRNIQIQNSEHNNPIPLNNQQNYPPLPQSSQHTMDNRTATNGMQQQINSHTTPHTTSEVQNTRALPFAPPPLPTHPYHNPFYLPQEQLLPRHFYMNENTSLRPMPQFFAPQPSNPFSHYPPAGLCMF